MYEKNFNTGCIFFAIENYTIQQYMVLAVLSDKNIDETIIVATKNSFNSLARYIRCFPDSKSKDSQIVSINLKKNKDNIFFDLEKAQKRLLEMKEVKDLRDLLLHKTDVGDICVIRNGGYCVGYTKIDCEDLFISSLSNNILDKKVNNFYYIYNESISQNILMIDLET